MEPETIEDLHKWRANAEAALQSLLVDKANSKDEN